MASLLQDPSGHYHVTFRFGGRRFKRSVRTKHERKAVAAASHVEENIRLISEGRMMIPDGADVPTFLMSDGRIAERPVVPENITLAKLFEEFKQSLPPDSLEANTLYIAAIHMQHITRILGGSKVLRTLSRKDLQRYVTARSKEDGHRGKLSPVTIRKEMGTFSSLWTWAVGQDFAEGAFPNKGLIYPKQQEKPPFQTWAQIERKIQDQGLSDDDASVLWECLYLNKQEIDELLDFIRTNSRHQFLYPMATIATHTGARRSELCRIQVSDVDIIDGVLTIRERKKAKSMKTTRSIPMSDKLTKVLSDWLDQKPNSQHLFPKGEGHCKESLSPPEAGHRLESLLGRGKWKHVKGWHVFRHSFISNCASNGVDQRFIDTWVGHQTEDQRRRYRHLFPESQKKIMQVVFA